jgi:hypothetical protein
MAKVKKKKKKYVFVKGSNPSVVWDPKGKGPLASFKDPGTGRVIGTFTTTDPEVAKTLKKLGYHERGEFPGGPPKNGFDEFVHDPPDHITPGGPPPKGMKGRDIVVKEEVTVTNETPKKPKTSKNTKPKKKKDKVVSKDGKKKKKKLVNVKKSSKKSSKSSD